MRSIERLSPSGISLYEKDPEEFYMKYLADEQPPNFAQTQPMAIGSAFDAYVKSHLHEKLFGKDNDPKYALDALFEAQVEEQHRDWARPNGKYAFEQYKQTGALADLMFELQRSLATPRFEFDIMGAVNGVREGTQHDFQEVVLLGKPDVHYINHAGYHVILDFKVNGYCSKTAPSPMQGYLRLRSAGKTDHGMHKKCQPMMHWGTMMDIANYLETYNTDWARQLSIYAWLCGVPVGGDFIVAIDQIVCKTGQGTLPSIRVAEHRSRVSSVYQWKQFRFACDIWTRCHSNHYFTDLSLGDSVERCKNLDERAKALGGNPDDPETFFANATRFAGGW